MGNENTEVSAQLKSMKKWIILGSISFLLIGISAIIFSVSIYTTMASMENEQSNCGKESTGFSHDKVTSLLNQGETKEALLIINKRLETHPNDSYALWFKAKAYYLKQDWEKALELIDKTEFLAPSWKEEFTEPLRQQINKFKQNT